MKNALLILACAFGIAGTATADVKLHFADPLARLVFNASSLEFGGSRLISWHYRIAIHFECGIRGQETFENETQRTRRLTLNEDRRQHLFTTTYISLTSNDTLPSEFMNHGTFELTKELNSYFSALHQEELNFRKGRSLPEFHVIQPSVRVSMEAALWPFRGYKPVSSVSYPLKVNPDGSIAGLLSPTMNGTGEILSFATSKGGDSAKTYYNKVRFLHVVRPGRRLLPMTVGREDESSERDQIQDDVIANFHFNFRQER